MTRDMIWKLAASSLVLGLTSTGCTMAGTGGQVNTAAAARHAAAGQQALESQRHQQAVVAAENAVASAPTVAEYRTLLGRTYLAAGRFASATTAFQDAMTLGSTDTRAIIGLTLAHIAMDRPDEGLALIERHQHDLSATDVGLAMALAGDSARAVYVLTQAVRRDGADPRTRQNLALTLALAGRWIEARMLAAQDVPLDQIEARLADWAKLAQEPVAARRVASLIGAVPSVDGGMPTRLALAPQADEAPVMASADPAPLAEYAPSPVSAKQAAAVLAAVDLPPSVAVPAAATPVAAPVVAARPALEIPLITADPAPYRTAPAANATNPVAIAAASSARTEPTRARTTAPAAPKSKLETSPLPRTTAFDAAKPAGWSVQLGAFDRLAVAQHKWTTLVRAHPVLANFHGSSHSAAVKGKSFHRLTVNGIASQADARLLCAQLAARGQGCFVRQMQGNENVRWAAAPTGVKLAAR